MRETRFIDQNRQKWEEAESLLNSPVKDPEKLGNLFVQVVDDLSYSRTYYPNRSVRVYLNKIARQYFSIIYSQRKERQNQFKAFWLEELPQLMIFSRREMLLSLLVFILALSIGIFSSIKDPQFVSTILGKNYVAMTEKNIAGGDPMAVYKSGHQVDMFLGITFNNLMVAFRTYVLGIFVGIGTLGSLLFNGVMVGCFQYYFVERGLFVESASSIWLHGTLEISSIILAGGAGLTLGRGLIFPGTYSRLQSLQIAGIRSMKIMLGITPVFVLAAIIESFLTRYTDAPAFFKILLIVLSAVFIIGYFVVYPWRKSKSGFSFKLKEVKLQATDQEPVNFTRIKSNADILKDAFLFFKRYNSRLLPWLFGAALLSSVIQFSVESEVIVYFEKEWWVELFSNMLVAMNTRSPGFIVANTLCMSVVLYQIMKLIDSQFRNEKPRLDWKSFFQILIVTGVLYTAIYMGILGQLFVAGAFGLLIMAAFVQMIERTNLAQGLARAWALFGKNASQGISLQFTAMLLSFSFLLLLSAPLLYIHMNILKWNFAPSEFSQGVYRFIELFVKSFSFYLVLPMVVAALSYLYFSQAEVADATNLKDAIDKMNARHSKAKR